MGSEMCIRDSTTSSPSVLEAFLPGAIGPLETHCPRAGGETARVGNLNVTMNECRYPSGNPAGDAYAELEIVETGDENRLFAGWMIASAPALSALEHPRYDIWVIRCTTS